LPNICAFIDYGLGFSHEFTVLGFSHEIEFMKHATLLTQKTKIFDIMLQHSDGLVDVDHVEDQYVPFFTKDALCYILFVIVFSNISSQCIMLIV
ncbi:hypothetical protein ACJX0J_039340, partial [Zea mays]